MLGPVTSGTNLAPASGKRYPGPVYNLGGIAQLDPLTVPGVLRVMLYNSPYPKNAVPPDGVPCVNEEAVVQVDDRYQPGGSQYDRWFDGVAHAYPLLQTGGLQFDDTGAFYLQAYNNVVQAGIGTFTGYFWGTYAAGSFWIQLGHQTFLSCIGVLADTFAIFDNLGSEVNNTGGAVSEGHILCRVSYNAITGECDLRATGATGSTFTAAPGSTFTFDTVSQAPGLDPGFANSSLLNRYLGSLLYDHVIPLGDATDLGIRQYIINNYGDGYTLDATPPVPPSNTHVYSGPITLNVSTTIKAIAVEVDEESSGVALFNYVVQCATPTASPGAGSYGSTQSVTLSCATSGAAIYYTTDGSTPTTGSTLYTGAISVASSSTVKAIAVKTGTLDSGILSAAYVISAGSPFLTGTPSGGTGSGFWLGMAITVGGTPMVVSQLGFWNISGNVNTHTVSIFRVSDNVVMATCSIATSGQSDGYLYAAASCTLAAGVQYIVAADFTDNSDRWYNTQSIAHDSAATVDYAAGGSPGSWGNGGFGVVFLPTNFIFT